jgi:amino acid transporter
MKNTLNNDWILAKFLRTLNLLEPGEFILSISKIALWTTLILTLWASWFTITYYINYVISVGSFLVTLNSIVFGNYIYRRKKQLEEPNSKEDKNDSINH